MRYLIGTGNRNWTDPNIWSLTSGGAPYKPASGTEKITNAADREFSSITGFWSLSNANITSGTLNITVNFGSASNGSLLTVDKWYKVKLDIVNLGIGFNQIGLPTVANNTIIFTQAETNKTVYFKALSTTFRLYGAPGTVYDNISIQEVDTIAPDATTSCIFDNNSGTGVIAVNAIANMLDFTCYNIGALTLANSAYAFNIYGSLTLHTNLIVTFTSTGYLYMKATDSRNITTNGKVANWNRLYFDGVNGTWTNQDDMNVGGSDFYFINGFLSQNNKLLIFSPTGSANKIISLGGKSYNKIQFSGSHTGNFDISGSNTIAELIIDSGRKVRFTAGTTQTIAKLTAIGTPSAPITLESITAGSRFNLTYTGVNASTVEYCSIKDSKVNQARRLLAKNSTNVGNNQNWGFDTLPPFALNTKQVDKIYYGSNQVAAMYIGTNKIY